MGDILLFKKNQEPLAEKIFERVKEKDHFIVAIGGLSGSGKTEIAHLLKRLLAKKKREVRIMSQDEFYKSGHEERRKEDISGVGKDEIDWSRFNNAIGNIYNARIYNIIVVEGLYALYCNYYDLGIYVDQDYEKSLAFRVERKKENPNCKNRKKVLEMEKKDILESRKLANMVVDYE